MTIAAEGFTDGYRSEMRLLRPLNGLPLINLVLINRDYSRFVGDAIDSIRRQDYPRLECVVIDNASTDHSGAVIEKHIGADARFNTLLLDQNLNQMGALLHILSDLTGDLVAVIDSDDFLLPGYASAHAQAHLSISGGVGLTSNCVLEVDTEGRILTGRYDGFATWRTELKRGLKEARELRVPTLSDAEYSVLVEELTLVDASQKGWLWSPGTANVYRREILQFARPPVEQTVKVAAVDNYYAPFANALASSALIGQPLSVYRFHTGNRFANSPSIYGLRMGSQSGVERSIDRRRDIISTLSNAPEKFATILGERFWDTMDIPVFIDDPSREACYASPQVQESLARNFAKLCRVLGEATVEGALKARMSKKTFDLFLREANLIRRDARNH